ncbi:sensor domain-containing diguanylate cyclase [Bacillus alkalicellulosilyticus]|uniref:sensor domain-containing diguanylate cyclase n=1 Tax=Alkalihalobacterium alkalicellulosilyticum TaxID=1912214 RepID=UPI001483393C|nr:sensor domain-containing diguanylate cyclase [Bacillus alkalicellulosilyticus]
MQLHFFIYFIPFLFLFAMAAEVFFRSPHNSLHRLTALLLLLFSSIFLADYHMVLLPLESAVVFITYFKFFAAFLSMILVVYFFKRISKIQLHWVFHIVFFVPFLGILLMLLFPTEFFVYIHEDHEGFRTETASSPLLVILTIATINTIIWNIVLLVIGEKKAKKNHYSPTFQKRFAVIYIGTIVTTIYLIVTSIIIYIGFQFDISFFILSNYISIIWAISIRYAMVKFDFLTTASQRFELLYQMSSNGIVLINKNGSIEEANSAFLTMVGAEKKDILTMSFQTLLKDDEKIMFSTFLDNTFLQTMPLEIQITINHKEDNEKIVQTGSGLIDYDGENFVYLVLHDITSQKLYEDKLKKMAYEDPLTGIGNRAFFHKQINTILENKPLLNQSLAIILVDLDKFKWINDTYGHAAGDAALRHVASQIQKSIPKDAHPIRMGGDEFAIILHVKNIDAIEQAVKSILSNINQPFLFQGTKLSLKGSAGISVAYQDKVDADRLLNLADKAMYKAKKTLGGNYHFSEDIEVS